MDDDDDDDDGDDDLPPQVHDDMPTQVYNNNDDMPYLSTVLVNPVLQAAPGASLLYDFSPQTEVTISLGHPLFPLVTEAATDPPFPSLTVICPPLDRSFVIPPQSSEPDAVVTVLDVLRGLHGWLQLRIRRDNYLALLPNAQLKVCAAYEARCARILDPAAQAAERQDGVKCVDLLLGLHVFAGLSRTVHGPDIFELHLCSGC